MAPGAIGPATRAARPTQVRFAWKPFTRALLFNRGNMPCSTFELPVKMAH